MSALPHDEPPKELPSETASPARPELFALGDEASADDAAGEEDASGAEPVGDASARDSLGAYLAEISRFPLLSAPEEAALAKRIERGDSAARDRLIACNLRLVVAIAKRYQRASGSLSLLDLIQEGTLGLIRAVDKFDWRRGNKFSTYATWWIHQAVQRAVGNYGATIRLPIHVGQQARKLRAIESRLRAAGREPSTAQLARAVGCEAAEIEQLQELAARRIVSLDQPLGDNDGAATLGELIADDSAGPDDTTLDSELTSTVAGALDHLTRTQRRVIELRFGLGGAGEHSLAETALKLRLGREQVRSIEHDALKRLRALPELARV